MLQPLRLRRGRPLRDLHLVRRRRGVDEGGVWEVWRRGAGVGAPGEFLLLNSGIDILPTVVRVAAEEPDTAAKKVEPTIFVCKSLPGKLFIHGDNPLNKSSDKRVL